MSFRDGATVEVVRRSKGYHWRICAACGNGYPSFTPSLEELQRYWNANRVADLPGDETKVWANRLEMSKQWADRSWDFLKPHLLSKTGRFLDIACGLGATVKKFQDLGWQAVGIDADPNTRRMHEQLGVTTTIGQFEESHLAGRFDLISIAHAIYFISNPRQFIKQVAESLNDDGLFLVIISDFTSLLGDNYPSQIHSWYPTGSSVRRALEIGGFGIVSTTKQKGSIMTLARKGDEHMRKVSDPEILWDALALRFQPVLHRWMGRPAANAMDLLKKLL